MNIDNEGSKAKEQIYLKGIFTRAEKVEKNKNKLYCLSRFAAISHALYTWNSASPSAHFGWYMTRAISRQNVCRNREASNDIAKRREF